MDTLDCYELVMLVLILFQPIYQFQISPTYMIMTELEKLTYLFYDRLRSDMIAKEIEGSITKIYLKKLRIYCRKYDWTYSGGLIRFMDPL